MGNMHQQQNCRRNGIIIPFGQETDNLGPSLGKKKRGIFGEERGILNIQRSLQHGVGSVFTHLPLQQHKKAEGSGDTNFLKEFPELPPSAEPIKYPSETNFSLAKLLSQAPVPQQNHGGCTEHPV